MVIVQFYIPTYVINTFITILLSPLFNLKCTGEAPEHITVTVLCNGTDSSTTYQIKQMNDLTELISVPQYQQCNISIGFSNEAVSSEPFIVAFGKYLYTQITYYKYYINRYISSFTNITNVTIIDTTILLLLLLHNNHLPLPHLFQQLS